MKKIVGAFFVILLAGCSAKKPWTKESIVNDCLRTFNKKNETEKRFTGMQIPYICDCMADKLVVKYKSDKESSADKEGVTKLSVDCYQEVMSK